MDATYVPAILQPLADFRYVVVFLLALVEGPVIMTFGGFLLRMDVFSFWPLYLTLMAGDLVADSGWYALGYYGGRPFVERFGKYFGVTPTMIVRAEELFHKYTNAILFISKITMGFGFALVTLLVAGMSRVPFRSYISFNAAGQFIWTALLMAIGYFFGDLYVTFNATLHRVFIITGLVMVSVLLFGLGRYLREQWK